MSGENTSLYNRDFGRRNCHGTDAGQPLPSKVGEPLHRLIITLKQSPFVREAGLREWYNKLLRMDANLTTRELIKKRYKPMQKVKETELDDDGEPTK